MIEEKYKIAIGVYLEERKNVNRYKNRNSRFKSGKLGTDASIHLLVEMGYKVVLFGDTITIIEPNYNFSL